MPKNRTVSITAGTLLALMLAHPVPAENPKDLFVKAGSALQEADFAEALSLYGQAESASSSAEGKADAANGAGFTCVKWHRFADAVTHLRRAVQLDPGHKTAWNNLGFAQLTLYEAGAADQAALEQSLAAFEKAAELDPASPGVAGNISLAKSLLDQEKAWAEAAAGRAGKAPRTVATDGTYQTYKDAGEAAEREGDFAFAQANFERAEAAGNSSRTKSAAANFQGLLALKMRDTQAAIKHCRRATALNPSNKYAWNNLGAALLKGFNAGAGGKELVENAISAFRKVAGLDSTYKPENLKMAEGIFEEIGGNKAAAPAPAE